ncbi:hypothetical protein QTP88_004857 [Uroleucon formosanum]
MKRSLPSQSSIFNFFHKKTNQTELDSELITTEEVPCASTTENGAIESTVDLPELRDIGRYVDVRITDDKFKYDLLKNPWLPSLNYNFPIVSKRKLKFQISWLTRFFWLVYSKQLEGALCKYFSSNQKVSALVSKPFIKWKDVLECFKLHSNAEYHKLSVIRVDEFLKIIDNKKPDISIAIDSAHKNIEVALRGDNDSGPIFSCSADNNDGNFRSLLRFGAQSGDLILKDHLENSAANAVYISPIIQNELINICGASIQTQIVTKIKNAVFFSILADETCDISRIEQMSLCVRYIEDCSIKEDFLTFISIYDASGKGLARTIMIEIDKLGLKKENLVGQGYDGASSMSDYFKSQLIERFIKHNYIISGLHNLIPSFLIKIKPSSDEFKKCIDFYKNFLPTYETFESELKVWVEKWKSVPDNELPKSAIDTLGVMSKDFYPNIWCLISILATLSVSTSSAERSFSTLRRLKTYLRNSCSEDRLTGLALLSVHRDLVRLILIVSGISSQFLDLVLVVVIVIVENPATLKYVVEKGINFFQAPLLMQDTHYKKIYLKDKQDLLTINYFQNNHLRAVIDRMMQELDSRFPESLTDFAFLEPKNMFTLDSENAF